MFQAERENWGNTISIKLEPWQALLLVYYPELRDSDPYRPEDNLFQLLLDRYGKILEWERTESDFDFGDAKVVTAYRIKEVQAQQFLDQHPKAFRKWREIE